MTGTCDLTDKRGSFIHVKDNIVSVGDELVQAYKDIINICHSTNSTCTILEIPPYSIRMWNYTKGHANSDSFKEDDDTLNTTIASVNEQIRVLKCLTRFNV